MLMSLLTPVLAQVGGGGQQGQSNPAHLVIMIGGCFAIIYFVMIRPQRVREKQRKALIDNLKKNDKVVTIGGIHGVVVSCKDDEVTLKIDEALNVKIRVSSAIAHYEGAPEEEGKQVGA